MSHGSAWNCVRAVRLANSLLCSNATFLQCCQQSVQSAPKPQIAESRPIATLKQVSRHGQKTSHALMNKARQIPANNFKQHRHANAITIVFPVFKTLDLSMRANIKLNCTLLLPELVRAALSGNKTKSRKRNHRHAPRFQTKIRNFGFRVDQMETFQVGSSAVSHG